LLHRNGYDDADLVSAGLSQQTLLAWYEREFSPLRTESSLPNLLRELDYSEPYAFMRLLLREYLFRRLSSHHAAPELDTAADTDTHMDNQAQHGR
jgi:hypothetical protein